MSRFVSARVARQKMKGGLTFRPVALVYTKPIFAYRLRDFLPLM